MVLTFGSWTVSWEDALAGILEVDAEILDGYDFSGRSAPDRVDSADVTRLLAGGIAEVTAAEAVGIMEAAQGAPWAAVPIDARLEEAAPASDLRRAAAALVDHFLAVPSVDSFKATLLLALKRPTLYAMVDDRVRHVYALAIQNAGAVSHPTTAAIREDLCRTVDQSAVTRLRVGLVADGGAKTLRLAQLPALRLRDLVLSQRWNLVGRPAANAVPWPGVAQW